MDLLCVFEIGKTFPFFEQLNNNDKIALCSNIAMPLYVLCSSFYSVEQNCDALCTPDGVLAINIFKNSYYKQDSVFMTMGDKLLRKAVQIFIRIKLSNEEFVLIRAIIYSHMVSPGLSDPAQKLLRSEAEKYSALLMNVVQTNYGPAAGALRYMELMGLIVSLFNTGAKHRQLLTYISNVLDPNFDKDFADQCLRYICQNASQLFEAEEFLQINQNLLYELLDFDQLVINNELEIWKANRRSALGPALFKIRFPLISTEHFSKSIVPSGILTIEEFMGVYHFHCHPNCCCVPGGGLYPLKFPTQTRISDWNMRRGNNRGTFSMEIEKFSEFSTKKLALIEKELMDPSRGLCDKNEDKLTLVVDVIVEEEKLDKLNSDPNKSNGTILMEIRKLSEYSREISRSERISETVQIKGLSWKIVTEIEIGEENNAKCLGFYLWCTAPTAAAAEGDDWSCKFSTNFRIVPQKSGAKDFSRKLTYNFVNNKPNDFGFPNFITFSELMDEDKGFYDKNEDKVTLAIDVAVNERKGTKRKLAIG
ncbi:hypothetical protein niasHT_026513 [Heterodera trifolii]|uniref:Uncharacterized protein n=1 Tax=Heterodera trifolii TaxID=157864 RepID=A0ABD2JTE0_9BILA